MEWRGAGGDGAASIPAFLFIGGVVQIVGAIMEWVLGNTFSFEVFMIFGELPLYNCHILSCCHLC